MHFLYIIFYPFRLTEKEWTFAKLEAFILYFNTLLVFDALLDVAVEWSKICNGIKSSSHPDVEQRSASHILLIKFLALVHSKGNQKHVTNTFKPIEYIFFNKIEIEYSAQSQYDRYKLCYAILCFK